MKYSLMKRWVKALRSGKYKQGTEYLCQDETDTENTKVIGQVYCCLGVLCDIEGINIGSGDTVLQESQIKLLQFNSGPEGDLPKPYKANGISQNTLAGLNDSGLTFKQIARIIEKNYKDL